MGSFFPEEEEEEEEEEKEEGEAIKCVYPRTGCRSLSCSLFHVFTGDVMVQLFFFATLSRIPLTT